MDAIAKWVVSYPEQLGLVVSFVVATLVQLVKKRTGWKRGTARWQKRVVGAVTSVLLVVAASIAVGTPVDTGRIVGVSISAWLGAQGAHALTRGKEKPRE